MREQSDARIHLPQEFVLGLGVAGGVPVCECEGARVRTVRREGETRVRRTEAVLDDAPRGSSEAGESAGRSLFDGEERMDALGLVTVRRGESSRQHSASERSDGEAPTSDRFPR